MSNTLSLVIRNEKQQNYTSLTSVLQNTRFHGGREAQLRFVWVTKIYQIYNQYTYCVYMYVNINIMYMYICIILSMHIYYRKYIFQFKHMHFTEPPLFTTPGWNWRISSYNHAVNTGKDKYILYNCNVGIINYMIFSWPICFVIELLILTERR